MQGGMILSSELAMKIDKIIEQLRKKINPRCIVLADISGRVISTYVSRNNIDVTSLAALFASNIGATGAIAEKIQETSGFDTIMQEGKNFNVFLSKVQNSYILAVVFSRSEQVGMVRLFTKKACDNLVEIAVEYEKQNSHKFNGKSFHQFSGKLAQQLSSILKDPDSM